jgi:hypothetical protein
MFSAWRVKSRTRELFKSYCKDWTLVFIVLVAFSIVDQLEPFHRQFSVRDITIQHPFAKQETVPVWLLLVSLGSLALAARPSVITDATHASRQSALHGKGTLVYARISAGQSRLFSFVTQRNAYPLL